MKTPSKARPGGDIALYELKITLRGSKPPIWRRFVVRADMTLDRLHRVIQISMGWTDSHLHQFIVGSVGDLITYGIPDPEYTEMGYETLNEKRYRISDIAPAIESKFLYEYDFGDNWQHDVVVEKELPPDPAFKHPLCLAGANACPPEDCSGIYGYYNMLEILANPKHPEHKDMKRWIGGKFDAAEFSLDAVNAALKRYKA